MATKSRIYLGPGMFAESLTEAAPPSGVEQFHSLTDRYEFAMRKAAQGCNYFVGYIDSGSNGQYGLSYGHSREVGSGMYIRDLNALVH